MIDRKSAFGLSVPEQQSFIAAVNHMNAGTPTTAYGAVVGIHADMTHRMHTIMGGGAIGRQRFLPWHRDFLLRFEQALRHIDQSVSVPYWQWSVNRSVPSWLSALKPKVAVPATPMSPPQVVQVSRSPHLAAGLPTATAVNSLDQKDRKSTRL